jgi:heterodisulfide reductase subunit A
VERIEDNGQVEERTHDLVVISPGLVPAWNPAGVLPIETGSDGFIQPEHPLLAPCRTTERGIFVAGTATGPKDIPDSIVEAGGAAMEAANYLRETGYAVAKDGEAEVA